MIDDSDMFSIAVDHTEPGENLCQRLQRHLSEQFSGGNNG